MPSALVRKGLVFFKTNLIITLIISCFALLGVVLVTLLFFGGGACAASTDFTEMIRSVSDDFTGIIDQGVQGFSDFIARAMYVVGTALLVITVVALLFVLSYYRSIFKIISTVKNNCKNDDYKPIPRVVRFMVLTIILIVITTALSIFSGLIGFICTLMSSAGILTCIITLRIHQNKVAENCALKQFLRPVVNEQIQQVPVNPETV